LPTAEPRPGLERACRGRAPGGIGGGRISEKREGGHWRAVLDKVVEALS
jgi:hypothetical protein